MGGVQFLGQDHESGVGDPEMGEARDEQVFAGSVQEFALRMLTFAKGNLKAALRQADMRRAGALSRVEFEAFSIRRLGYDLPSSKLLFDRILHLVRDTGGFEASSRGGGRAMRGRQPSQQPGLGEEENFEDQAP